MSDLTAEDVEEIVAEATADLQERVDDLEDELADERERRREAEQRVDDLEDELSRVRTRVDGNGHYVRCLKSGVAELQSRELEKSAHLRWDNVDPWSEQVETSTDGLERIVKDEGKFARLPGAQDDVAGVNGGDVRLSRSDLLPVQQLAQLPDGELETVTTSKTVRWAVRAWQERGDGALWTSGGPTVREYMTSRDLRTWLRVEHDEHISTEAAKKLSQRVMDALSGDLARNRLTTRNKQRRQDGLNYVEKRLIVPEDTEIPGEGLPDGDAPETAVVPSG